ncbi:MAG: hypothetical protein J6R47_04215 [Acholeplasmatales bacterium]|nr:hypothetical protein [Acholeplasmatales bacterium]
MDRKVKKAIIKICPEAKQAFKDGKDVYAFMASRIFNVPYEECCPYDLKNAEGYKYCENYSRATGLRRNIAKLYVLLILYPSIKLINEIDECYNELNHYL